MRPIASLVPTAACAVGSTRISIPAAAMRGPPMPTSRTPGSSARSARHSVPPWRSPDASPAESMIGARSVTGSAAAIVAHHGDPGPVRDPDHLVAVHEQHLPAVTASAVAPPSRMAAIVAVPTVGMSKR